MALIPRMSIPVYIILASQLLGCCVSVRLQGFGVMPLKNDDVTLVIYATIEVKTPSAVGLKMEKCCQYLENSEEDCESMVLHSGLTMELNTNDVRNLTIYFTNTYLNGRNGKCTINLRWKPMTKEGKASRDTYGHQEFDVLFNTTLDKQSSSFLPFWKSDSGVYSVCTSTDMDPTNDCQSVNCLVKNSGHRSFYNKKTTHCEKSPVCVDLKKMSKESAKNPTSMLSPILNKCINLFSPKEFPEAMQFLNVTLKSRARDSKTYPIGSNCVTGELINSNTCECKSGWTTTEFDAENFNPNTDTYMMCDIRSNDGEPEPEERAANASTSLYVLLVLAVLVLILLCIGVPIYLRRRQRRKYEGMKTKKSDKDVENPSRVISEIKNRREIVLPPTRPFPTKTVSTTALIENQPGNASSSGKDSNPIPKVAITKPSLEPSDPQEGILLDIDNSSSRSNLLNSSSTTYISSVNRKSPLTSKKIFLPQISKTSLLQLPPPLTPTIASGPVSPSQSSTSHNVSKESLSPESRTRLDSFLQELEASAKLLEAQVKDLTNEVSEPSVYQSLENLEVKDEKKKDFWDVSSDSADDSSPEIDVSVIADYWVRKTLASPAPSKNGEPRLSSEMKFLTGPNSMSNSNDFKDFSSEMLGHGRHQREQSPLFQPFQRASSPAIVKGFETDEELVHATPNSWSRW